MSVQWRLCLVARDGMHTVVAVNTVNRAAMGAEQGIAILTRKKHLPPVFFLLFPAISWAAVSTAYFSEDSKTDEPIKISTIFRFFPRTWTHFLSKPRNKPSLGHICVVSFNIQNVLMTLFPLVWSADTTPVHAHNCTTRTIQSA